MKLAKLWDRAQQSYRAWNASGTVKDIAEKAEKEGKKMRYEEGGGIKVADRLGRHVAVYDRKGVLVVLDSPGGHAF